MDINYKSYCTCLYRPLAGYIRNQRLQKKIERGELDAMPEVKEADAECCGQHEICERDSLLAAVSKR